MKCIHVATAVFVAITATSALADLTTLSDGVPVPNLSGVVGNGQSFVIEVPDARDSLVITTSGGWGDADLYVRYGTLPVVEIQGAWDYRPFLIGNDESVIVDPYTVPVPLQAGMWYIVLYGYDDYSGVTLEADYTPDVTPVPLPGAVLLGMLGLGAAGLKLRNRG